MIDFDFLKHPQHTFKKAQKCSNASKNQSEMLKNAPNNSKKSPCEIFNNVQTPPKIIVKPPKMLKNPP